MSEDAIQNRNLSLFFVACYYSYYRWTLLGVCVYRKLMSTILLLVQCNNTKISSFTIEKYFDDCCGEEWIMCQNCETCHTLNVLRLKKYSIHFLRLRSLFISKIDICTVELKFKKKNYFVSCNLYRKFANKI